MKWIPISFCQMVIEQKLFGCGKLFCYLKHRSSGITNKALLPKTSTYFKVSPRTVKRWLNQAIDLNWIGYDKRTDTLYVRSWQYLFDKFYFRKKACFKFTETILKDFPTYCYAAVISYMARAQVRKLERKLGRSKQASACVPMAASAIAITLNVSIRTAQKFRNKAVEQGYIRKRENLEPYPLNINEVAFFRKYSPQSEKIHLVIRNRNGLALVYRQLPDLVTFKKELIHTPRRFKVSKICHTYPPSPPRKYV